VYLKDDKTVDIDRESLWDTKCKVIAQTPGLSILDTNESFEELDGCDNIINFLKKFQDKYRVVTLVDEIDKAFSAANTDTSGTTQDQHSAWLTWMQDKEVDGIICIGVPGSGKSAVVKAAAKHYGCVGVGYDFGAMKSKFVGESGQQTRQGLRIIDAVGQGKVLVIATCNNIAVLPTELRRRFTLGTFFFDSPTDRARQGIWKIYEKKYGVSGEHPEDVGWTGAEIKQCCKLASRTGTSLVEASRYIVPVTVSAKDQIDQLRTQARGKFTSAAKSGVYVKDEVEYLPKKKRQMNLKDIES
jgi:hypothetical protein